MSRVTKAGYALGAEVAQRVIEQWDPEMRPVHCSNCVHAKVSMNGQLKLRVHCEMIQGRASLDYFALMRLKRPVSFRPAKKCPDWHSMSDDA